MIEKTRVNVRRPWFQFCPVVFAILGVFLDLFETHLSYYGKGVGVTIPYLFYLPSGAAMKIKSDNICENTLKFIKY